ncbi:glycoside hydrolase family 88 protein [Desertivirga xinjiangensis]|uniref:glycoside hydrolase family 88 protein n=1 Tax=Desertivirga xinjiangensis TaxID=539206 RepID=UPI00210EE511|nr:glycoside hydrolase family 88 protein [Pedobacter xinjiangensis]
MVFLLVLVFILSYLLLKPLFKRKFGPVKLLEFNDLKEVEHRLRNVALQMAASKTVYMAFGDEDSLYRDLARIKQKLKRDSSLQNYAYFNFPRAWLLIGLFKFGIERNDETILHTVVIQSSHLINEVGELKFRFNKIDQALFGLLFLNLFEHTKELKYRKAAEQIYSHIQVFKNKEGLYLYRKTDNILFIDTLGMLLPFLYEYALLKGCTLIKEEANLQIKKYLQYASNSGEILSFPSHAYDLNKKMKLGSVNWSRGMGWFLIGLAYSVKSNEEDLSFKDIFENYWRKIESLNINHYWPQFLGHNYDYSIDSSATIMFYYANALVYGMRNNKLNSALRSAISTKGFVELNSGDTIYINNYSRIKGRSELSQGLLLLTLAK